MAGVEEVAEAFGFGRRAGRDRHETGLVEAVNADGSYQVALGGASARCAPYTDAAAGDRVLVLVTGSGRAMAVATYRGR